MRPAGLHMWSGETEQRQTGVSQGHHTPQAHRWSDASLALIVLCWTRLMCRSPFLTIISAVSLQGTKWQKLDHKLLYVQRVRRLPQGWKPKEEFDLLSGHLTILWHQLMDNDVVLCLIRVKGKKELKIEPIDLSAGCVNMAKDDSIHHERIYCAAVSFRSQPVCCVSYQKQHGFLFLNMFQGVSRENMQVNSVVNEILAYSSTETELERT